jgi:Tol biopolymer transport system component
MRLIRTLLLTCVAMGAFADPSSAAVTERIVFASDRGGDSDIYAMDPDGSNLAQLTNSPGDDLNPAISPDGTLIAYNRPTPGGESDVWVMNADGTGQHFFTFSAEDPTWSPDGTKIVFGSIGHGSRDGDIYAMNADGTGTATPIAYADRDNLEPALSADGTKIAWIGQIDDAGVGEGLFTMNTGGTGRVNHSPFEPNDHGPDWRPDSQKLAFSRDAGIVLMNRDGTGLQPLTSGAQPSWSPTGSHLAFTTSRDGNQEIYKVTADGTTATRLTNNAASDVQPDWGLLEGPPGYPRPKGATPMRISLVTANTACTAPNRTHGPPLGFPSCAPPQLTSSYLTVGTGDSNARPALMQSSIRLDVLPGNPATPADEADVRIDASLTDVFNKDLSDYTGDLRASVPLTLTDHGSGGFPGTTVTSPLEFNVPCTGTADTQAGSNCALLTTVDTLYPGAAKEGMRAIWAVGQAKVYDGGPDSNASTTGDNTLFATQGVFIP